MIKLIAMPMLAEKIGLSTINEKLNLFQMNDDSLSYHLRNINFDHRFTKPFNVTAYDIVNIFQHENASVVIRTYKQNYFAWKMFPVNVCVPSDKKNVIYVNSRQLERRTASDWEETIWHELIHVADSLSIFNFNHGDNDLSGKEETAPVKLAKILASLSVPKIYKEKNYV